MKIPGTNTHIYIGKNPDSDLTTEQKNRPELGPGPTNWKPLSVYVGSKSMQNTLNKLMEWKQVGKGRFEKTTILGDGTKWTSFKHDSAITKTSNWKNNQNGTFTRKHIDKDEREWSQSIDAFDNIGMFTRTQLDESGRKWSYSMNNFGDITKTSNWMKNQDGTTRKHIDKDEREWSKSMSASRETGMFTRTEVDESGRKWSYSMNASGEITSTTGWEKQDDDTYARTIIRPGGILIDESITEAVYLRKTEQEAEALANDNEMNAAISIQHKYRARKKREQLVVNNYGYIAVTDENKNVLCYTKPNVGHKPGERLTKQILPLPPQVDYVDSLSGSMKFVSHCDDPATLPKLNTDKYAVKPNTTRKLYLGLTFRDKFVGQATPEKEAYHDQLFAKIQNHLSFVRAYQVTDTLSLSELKNRNLLKAFNDGEKFQLSHFKEMLEGMKLAHQQDIIIGDRKPENSLIGDNVNLFHADLDTMICLHNLEERVTRKKGKYSAIATDGYGFNPDIVDGEPRSVKEFLMAHGKADDEYAMLRVLMLLTSGKNIGSFNQVKKTVDGREKIETQITRLVKPEYHDRIKCLCFAPDEYARIYKDNPQYLVDMLNFEPRSPA